MSENNGKDSMDGNLASNLTRLNVGAKVFVPRFSMPPTANPSPAPPAATVVPQSTPAPAPTPAPTTQPQQQSSVPSSSAGESAKIDDSTNKTDLSSAKEPAGETSAAPEDWETNADNTEDDYEEGEEGEEDDELEDIAGDKDKKKSAAGRPAKKKVAKPGLIHNIKTKDHLNVVFIGHVDAGKSTIGGQLLYLTGQVDKRTLEKYEREAKEKNRESWYLSWALDTNQEERDKGKTVEVGRAYFETENKHFTLLDAPGHRGFVPNMIGGAAQADLAVLVISARKGEFETGFERGGQTREHAMLAKTAGVKQLIVLINKMDDPTVEWSKERYDECCEKLMPYLRKCGFNPKTELYFMPCSGLNGAFLRDVVPESLCPWFRGPSFLEYLDKFSFTRDTSGPFRMVVVDKYKDMGTVVFGKVESGTVSRGDSLILMPNRRQVEILQLWSDEDEVSQVSSGENVKIKLKGVEEEDVTSGFVLCEPDDLCAVGKVFDCQVAILEHKSIICSGYSAVLHIHCAIEEVTVRNIIDLIDKKTGKRMHAKPRFVKQDQLALMRLECQGGSICAESFSKFPQMGRFTLRDEGKTIAIGKILRVVE